MKKKFVSLIPYVIVLALDFYLLPLLIKDTGTAMFFVLFIIPLIAFVCSVVYGTHRSFDFLIPIVTMILFVPTIFIYYNSSAWVYIVAYAIVTLVGEGVGKMFNKNR